MVHTWDLDQIQSKIQSGSRVALTTYTGFKLSGCLFRTRAVQRHLEDGVLGEGPEVLMFLGSPSELSQVRDLQAEQIHQNAPA